MKIVNFKVRRLSFVVLSALPLIVAQASDKFKLDDFSISLEQLTSFPQHIWVSSGYTTVNPINHTVTGVGEFYSPPFAANKFTMLVNVLADNNPIIDDAEYFCTMRYAGGEWFPHKIVRYGTYHRQINGKLISLGVTSELVPLFGQSGFTEKITYTNRAATPVELKVSASMDPGTSAFIPLNRWQYCPPFFRTPIDPYNQVVQSRTIETGRWSNESVNIGVYLNNEHGVLKPGQSLETTATVMMIEKDKLLPEKVDGEALIKTSVDAWQKRLDTYTGNIPALTTDIEGLGDYYKRSVLSGLVCIWENPSFITNPFLATLGMDGGGICTYLWDTGYAPNLVSLMLGSKVEDIVRHMGTMDLNKHFAFSPDGTSHGVRYFYSIVSFTKLVSVIFKYFAPDRELFEYAKRLILDNEKRKQSNNLIDCGTQDDLMEMNGRTGWEHFVASPNAERSWCLNQLAEMGKYTGTSETEREDWKQQAGQIIDAIRKELWDEEKQWFAAIYPDGLKEYVYTSKVFDALRAGACTPTMEKALVAELNDQGYLDEYGMSAVSKKDKLHYEVVDVDWSGGGAYIGEGPQTALIMYEKNHPEVGWDILKRHFWMGKQCPYFPQDAHNTRPMSSTVASKLYLMTGANEIAALMGAEAILFGLIGFQPQYDGTLYINPQLTVKGNISLKGFGYKNNTFDVEVSASKMTVNRNGQTIYKGKPKRVEIL